MGWFKGSFSLRPGAHLLAALLAPPLLLHALDVILELAVLSLEFFETVVWATNQKETDMSDHHGFNFAIISTQYTHTGSAWLWGRRWGPRSVVPVDRNTSTQEVVCH